MKEYTLGRSERLKSEKGISELFDKGYSISTTLVRLVYRKNAHPDTTCIKAGFSVPKKNFKKAVDRNYLKRLMRESYRRNKDILSFSTATNPPQIDIMFIFQGKTLSDFESIETSIISLLKKLNQKLGS